MRQSERQKILIADDSELNRAILADMLEPEFEVIEAEDGVQAVSLLQKQGESFALLLLDIVMPELDGFGVLRAMNERQWINEMPVIMISAESAPDNIERAYDLGVTDFISRPFDALIVRHRVLNTILLYGKQKKLMGLVEDQIYEKERQSNLMIDILSHIVEFRNGESGRHVLHIHTLTNLLLRRLCTTSSRYQFTGAQISLITTASALHDIGKIAIPEQILNKPGRLTPEEYEVIKTHAEIGSRMLRELPMHQSEQLVQIASEICRWHHERFDGKGYPDGLVGDQIPIHAQIVALADVYDALTSERVYKKAFSHEKAVQMILNGECGVFSPLLLRCLSEAAPEIPRALKNAVWSGSSTQTLQDLTSEALRQEDLTISERTMRLLEHERMKYSFFADMSEEIQFEYTLNPEMVTLTPYGAQKLGLEETVLDPYHNKKAMALLEPQAVQALQDKIRSTTPERPVVQCEFQLLYPDGPRWTRFVCRATWSGEEPPRYMGAIGKAVDIHDARLQMTQLEWQATHDAKTGLFNHRAAKDRITERLQDRSGARFLLAIVDLDYFKQANDTYGHLFGDEVLAYMAHLLRTSVRSGDIVARVGGDEFLICMEYKGSMTTAIERIYHSLCGVYKGFTLSVSMGVAQSDQVGPDFDALFHAADLALYKVKRSGRGHYQFYDEGIEQSLSEISPIEGDPHAAPARAGSDRL